MAEKLTVAPFPKDMRTVLEHLVEFAKHKAVTTAIRKCGILYEVSNLQRSGVYPMDFNRVSSMDVNEIAIVVEDPSSTLLLLKYEDDEVSEP